jgi:hypothetical protein
LSFGAILITGWSAVTNGGFVFIFDPVKFEREAQKYLDRAHWVRSKALIDIIRSDRDKRLVSKGSRSSGNRGQRKRRRFIFIAAPCLIDSSLLNSADQAKRKHQSKGCRK